MAAKPTSIRPLPPESQVQIRSSVIITSLNDVVVGLLENVLDAGATSAEIRLDYIKGYCSITDNGFGIPAADFSSDGHLGSLHCTSKLDVDRPTYGSYGRFLHHISALSLLSIASRHDTSTSRITMHRANVIARSNDGNEESDSIREGHGTNVVVDNLFGDIPVRFRHNAARLESIAAADAEFNALKTRLAALVLACGRSFDVKVFDIKNKRTYKHKSEFSERHTSFDLGAICSALRQAGYIDCLQLASFDQISIQSSSICIRAVVSLEPAPAKDVQFISIGHRPLCASTSTSLFFDEINAIFELSDFGAAEDEIDFSENKLERRRRDRRFASGRHTNHQLSVQKKGVDKWPMFYVRVDLQDMRASSALQNGQDESGHTEKYIEKILYLLRSLFYEFLSVHHFRPRARKGRRFDKVDLTRNAAADSTLEPVDNFESHIRHLPLRTVSESSGGSKHFDAWSRVKTGITTAKPIQTSKRLDEDEYLESGGNANTCPQTPAERMQAGQNALGEVELQALDDMALMLLVEDYHDEGQSGRGTPKPDAAVDHDKHSETNGAEYIETVEATYLWTDPTTGVEHKINARNGLIVPQGKLTNSTTSIPSSKHNYNRPTSAPTGTLIAHRVGVKPVKKSPAELIASLQQSDLISSFRPFEERIPSIVSDELDDLTAPQQSHDCGHSRRKTSEHFSTSVAMTSHNLSKADLDSAEVLAQVDQKFILVQTQPVGDSDPLLVLIDQHAADERVKVEELYTQLCTAESTTLTKPIVFEVSKKEIELFTRRQKHFAEWQIVYLVECRSSEQDSTRQVVVGSLPSIIAERCRLDPKLLIDLLRREIHQHLASSSLQPYSSRWIHRIPHCPQGLVEMINSRACRSAIMFNDVLDKRQCEQLLRNMVKCTLPFQCAHGRPSCVVLPGWARKGVVETDGLSFAAKFRAWTHSS